MEERVILDVSGGSVAMTEHAVVIAGGGPAGMMLAAELALAKVGSKRTRVKYTSCALESPVAFRVSSQAA